ncbi:NAD-dependent epimerase/dehydratase family protein [Actinoplanes couchii]|uniref:NAD-dependent dehydratase n=1 Tax=Actinoplanes couchii TaxID=403638 RepID=A0ABQ3XHE8_9ACTN|nr:NAD(P)-dependent oxidoreductase [Actinoplanes couchii]MDR6317542.1 nucleoside-diphosphate-sugar epimerase [Actinoplanes couchii]GID57924.1 NAD-dependent dehydratase [Actinoplanes couchii]
MAVILMTGASGRIGRMLRDRLGHHELRLTDLRGEDGVDRLDVTDGVAVERAARGADAILHLGGIPGEASFDELLAVNVGGTERVLAAAHRAGVPRVILASSNHAAGLQPRPRIEPETPSQDQTGWAAAGRAGLGELPGKGVGGGGLPDDVRARADGYYGWSKAAVEGLGRLYHDRYGMHVVCLRIGKCAERPATSRDLSVWISPDDMARLVEASLTATGWRVVWGVSANTRRWWSEAGGRSIGYLPVDDAERWAGDVTEEGGHDLVGGGISVPELGRPIRRDGKPVVGG